MSLMLRRRMLLSNTIAETPSLLPKEYQQVEYIESTGTQCLNTNVLPYVNADSSPVRSTKLYIEFEFTTEKIQAIFGSQNTSSSGLFKLRTGSSGALWFAISASDYMGNLLSGITKHSALIYARQSQIDGENVSTYYGTNFSGTFPIYLFALNNAGNIENFANAKIYTCQIYNDDELIRDFIPCYRKSDSEIGLYDLVERKFYTNQGTGTFLKGADIDVL